MHVSIQKCVLDQENALNGHDPGHEARIYVTRRTRQTATGEGGRVFRTTIRFEL